MRDKPARPRGFHLALAFVWGLVAPGILLTPSQPGTGLLEAAAGHTFQVLMLAGTCTAFLWLLRQLQNNPPADPRSQAQVTHSLDSIQATWTTDTPHPRSVFVVLYGLALQAWLMFGVVWSARLEAVPFALSVVFGGIVVATALPWLLQLWSEVRLPRNFRLHATIDRVRIESRQGSVELPTHELVAQVPGETLRLDGGGTTWSGPCPDGPGRRELLHTLQDIARNGFEALFQVQERVIERILRCYAIRNEEGDFPTRIDPDPVDVCGHPYQPSIDLHYGGPTHPGIQPDSTGLRASLVAGAAGFNSSRLRLEIPLTVALAATEAGLPSMAPVPADLELEFPLRQDGKQILLRPSHLARERVTATGGPSLNDLRELIALCITEQAANGDGNLVDRLSGLIPVPDGDGVTTPFSVAYEVWLFDAAHPVAIHAIDFETDLSGRVTLDLVVQITLAYLPTGLRLDASYEVAMRASVPFTISVAPSGDQATWRLLVNQLQSSDFTLPGQVFDEGLLAELSYVAVDLLQAIAEPITESDIGALEKVLRFGLLDAIDFSTRAVATFTVPHLSNEPFEDRLWEHFRSGDDIVLLSLEDNDFVENIAPRVFERAGLSIGINGAEAPSGSVRFAVPPSNDFRLQLDATVLQPDLDTAAENARVDANARTDDARVNSLSVRLGNQSFDVVGQGDIFIDCWPDPTFDLDGRILVSGVQPGGELRLTNEDGFDVELHQDCGVSAIYVLVGLLTGSIGVVVLGVLHATVFQGDGNAPDDDELDDLSTVGPRGLIDSDSAVVLSLVFQDVSVLPLGITFFGRMATPCSDRARLGRRSIRRVQWGANREIVAVELDTGWQYRPSELMDLMRTGAIEMLNANIVRGAHGDYLRSPPNKTTSDNLDNLPKFVMDRGF